MKVLYSAIGGTDPISNCRDGSLLHICRVYKPDKVYLLMSKEILENHKRDNRYIKCLKMLENEINHHFDYQIIKRDDLVNVHEYDVVYSIISENIDSIRKELKEDDVFYVNVASGTPAIKYCLQILSALASYKFIVPICVSTPEGKMNSHTEDKDHYTIEELWELNLDNTSEFLNRCFENKSIHLLKDIYDSSLVKLIENYDYSAALTFISTVTFYSDDLKSLLVAAEARLNLDTGNAERILRSYSFQLPFADEKNKKLFEYALSLGVMSEKNDYGNFARSITPLLFEINLRSINKYKRIEIENYFESMENDKGKNKNKTKNKIKRWDREKLKGSDIEKILLEKFENFNYSIVYNSHLREIINTISDENRAITKLNEVNNFEEKIRNLAAHEMESITDKIIKKETGFTIERIFENIVDILANLSISKDDKWKSYEDMNRFIIESQVNSLTKKDSIPKKV